MPKADLGDLQIYYEAHGDGPPLLLVPGLGGGHCASESAPEAFNAAVLGFLQQHR